MESRTVLRTSEHLEQVRLVAWFRKNYPEHLIFAIPNGGHRSKPEAGRLKAEGVLSGVHDLFIPSMRLFIEMKRDNKEKPKPAQIEFADYVEKHGYKYFFGYGFEDAKNKLKLFLKNT